jgi:hypothetical protein
MAQPLGRDPSRPFAALAAHEDPSLSHPGHTVRRARQRDAARPSPTEGSQARIIGLASFRSADRDNAGWDQAEGRGSGRREWNGRLERVMILDQGVTWNGETYSSPQQVAKAMTGTSWNGHRFFGLRTAGSDRSGMVPCRSGDCDAASLDAASVPIKDGGAALGRQPSRQAASYEIGER